MELSILMGLAWLFGLVASFTEFQILWYPFIVLCSLQGTFIFIFFDMKKKVYYTAYEKILGKPHPNRKSNRKRYLLDCLKYPENEYNKTMAMMLEKEDTNQEYKNRTQP